MAEEGSSRTSILEGILKFFSILLVVIGFPFSFIFCLKTVQEYERAIIFRLGRVKEGVVGPGLFFILPFMDTVSVVDLRTISFDVPACRGTGDSDQRQRDSDGGRRGLLQHRGRHGRHL